MASGKRVASAISSLVNARDLQLDCARVLHGTLLVPVLMYRYQWTGRHHVSFGNIKGEEIGVIT